MKLLKKLAQNFASLIAQTLLLLTILIPPAILGFIAPPFTMIVFWGFNAFLGMIADEKNGHFRIMERNKNYGSTTTNYVTRDIKVASIKNSYGSEIGSITRKETEIYDSEDDRRWVCTKNSHPVLYIIFYPIIRVVSLFFAVLAFFTDKFYVKFSAPDDFNEEDYNGFLFSYFDVVYRRTAKQIARKNEKLCAKRNYNPKMRM